MGISGKDKQTEGMYYRKGQMAHIHFSKLEHFRNIKLKESSAESDQRFI